MKDVNKEIGAAVEDDEKVGYDTKITHNIAFVYCYFGVRVLHCDSDDKLFKDEFTKQIQTVFIGNALET